MNEVQEAALMSLRYLESALDFLSTDATLAKHRLAFSSLAARSALLRTQLSSGMSEELVQLLLSEYIADYQGLLMHMRREE